MNCVSDICSLRISPNIRTRRSTDSFDVPLHEQEIAIKLISYLGSKIWNDLNQDIEASASVSSFKHALNQDIEASASVSSFKHALNQDIEASASVSSFKHALNQDIEASASVSSFKHALKRHFFDY